MNHPHVRRVALLLPVLLALAVSAATAATSVPLWEKRNFFAAKLGFITFGDVAINGLSTDTDPGFTMGVAWDVGIDRRFSGGLSFDLHRIYVTNEGEYLFDVSLAAKAFFLIPRRRVAIRPGVAIGYGRATEVGPLDYSNHLIVKTTLEGLFFSKARSALLGELGVMSSVSGSDGPNDIRLGPYVIARIGILF